MLIYCDLYRISKIKTNKNMIRAVCFNKKSFAAHVIKRICAETKGVMGGCLTDPALVNCIESFPDGTIYLSYVGNNMPKNVYNCKDDINRFIQANKNFGGKWNDRISFTFGYRT